jgi:hypothetical protein
LCQRKRASVFAHSGAEHEAQPLGAWVVRHLGIVRITPSVDHHAARRAAAIEWEDA